MGLAHRHRQAALPGAVELTEARVPVSAGLGGDIFLPQDRQRHVLAFELAVHGRPVGLGDAAVTLTVAIAGLREQAKFQNRVGDVVWQRPAQARGLEPPERQAHRRGRRAHPSRNLAARQPGRLHSDHIAHTAHRKPLRRHPGSPSQSRKSTGGRLQIGMVGEIISESWATSIGIRTVQTGKDGMALVEHSFGPVLVIRVWSVLFSSTTDLLRAKPQLFGNERSEVRSICL
ncbi:hypothetical protein ACVIN2_003104 [Bradyrhizobium sp. USDA 3650]